MAVTSSADQLSRELSTQHTAVNILEYLSEHNGDSKGSIKIYVERKKGERISNNTFNRRLEWCENQRLVEQTGKVYRLTDLGKTVWSLYSGSEGIKMEVTLS